MTILCGFMSACSVEPGSARNTPTPESEFSKTATPCPTAEQVVPSVSEKPFTPTSVPTYTSAPEITKSITPTPTLAPVPTEVPSLTPTLTPVPTETPTPVPTETPAPTPTSAVIKDYSSLSSIGISGLFETTDLSGEYKIVIPSLLNLTEFTSEDDIITVHYFSDASDEMTLTISYTLNSSVSVLYADIPKNRDDEVIIEGITDNTYSYIQAINISVPGSICGPNEDYVPAVMTVKYSHKNVTDVSRVPAVRFYIYQK